MITDVWEQYGAALTAFKGQNVNVLLYLARAWYGYANRESNFSAMNQALSYCQKVSYRCGRQWECYY